MPRYMCECGSCTHKASIELWCGESNANTVGGTHLWCCSATRPELQQERSLLSAQIRNKFPKPFDLRRSFIKSKNSRVRSPIVDLELRHAIDEKGELCWREATTQNFLRDHLFGVMGTQNARVADMTRGRKGWRHGSASDDTNGMGRRQERGIEALVFTKTILFESAHARAQNNKKQRE